VALRPVGGTLPESVGGVGYFASQDVSRQSTITAVQQAAKQLGVLLIIIPLEGTIQEAEYRRVFGALKQGHAHAIIVSDQLKIMHIDGSSLTSPTRSGFRVSIARICRGWRVHDVRNKHC
jgi:hypothetical protein